MTNGSNNYTDDAFIMGRGYEVTSVLHTDGAMEVYTDDAQCVRLSTKYLKEIVDVAEALAPNDEVWLTVEDDKPTALTPTERTGVTGVVAPRVGPNVESEKPTEDTDE